MASNRCAHDGLDRPPLPVFPSAAVAACALVYRDGDQRCAGAWQAAAAAGAQPTGASGGAAAWRQRPAGAGARRRVLAATAGYDEINLNVGCPSDRVQSGRFGACLMREPALVGDCVKAMRDAVDVPVTVKCRIGVDDQDEYADLQHFTEIMLEAGVEVLVVHARKAWLQGLSAEGEPRDSAARLRARVSAQARVSAAGRGHQRRHHHGRSRCRRICARSMA